MTELTADRVPVEARVAKKAPRTVVVEDLLVERHDRISGRRFVLDVPYFEARTGDRIGLVGESGSGKTTFLEMLGLLSWPGAISSYLISPSGDGRMKDLTQTLRKQDSNTLTAVRAACIGFIAQDGGLLPYLSVFGNAALAVELSRGSKHVSRARIEEIAGRMGIADMLDRMPAQLSGGQKQRAAVLRALATAPSVLIGDEPTAALDPSNARDVIALLSATTEAVGATVILASHNAGLLRDFGFRIHHVHMEEEGDTRRARLIMGEECQP